jgi:hypothetical protein
VRRCGTSLCCKYNPDTLSRTFQVKGAGAEIKLNAEVDAMKGRDQ